MNQKKLPEMGAQESLLPHSEIKGLAPRERDTYIQNVILRILDRAPRGVTVSEVSAFTGFSRPTVSKHLEVLLAIGEAYEVERGNLSIYHRNGKVVHEEASQSISTPDKAYNFYILQNDKGRFLYIQEREEDEYKLVRVRGGITINMKDLPAIVRKITELQE